MLVGERISGTQRSNLEREMLSKYFSRITKDGLDPSEKRRIEQELV